MFRRLAFILCFLLISSLVIREARAGNGASAPVHGIFAINAVHLQTYHGVSSYKWIHRCWRIH